MVNPGTFDSHRIPAVPGPSRGRGRDYFLL
jgi:hypothetical protein